MILRLCSPTGRQWAALAVYWMPPDFGPQVEFPRRAWVLFLCLGAREFAWRIEGPHRHPSSLEAW